LGLGVVGVDGLGFGELVLGEGFGVGLGAVDEEGGAVVVLGALVVLGAGTVVDGASLAVVDGVDEDDAGAAPVLEELLPPSDSPPHPDSAVARASTPAARTVVERSRFCCMVSLSSAHGGTPPPVRNLTHGDAPARKPVVPKLRSLPTRDLPERRGRLGGTWWYGATPPKHGAATLPPRVTATTKTRSGRKRLRRAQG
jgi:hypothetical protein